MHVHARARARIAFAGLEVSGGSTRANERAREKGIGRKNEADEDDAAGEVREKVVRLVVMVGSLFSRAKG